MGGPGFLFSFFPPPHAIFGGPVLLFSFFPPPHATAYIYFFWSLPNYWGGPGPQGPLMLLRPWKVHSFPRSRKLKTEDDDQLLLALGPVHDLELVLLTYSKVSRAGIVIVWLHWCFSGMDLLTTVGNLLM